MATLVSFRGHLQKFFYVSEYLPACAYVRYMHAWCPREYLLLWS